MGMGMVLMEFNNSYELLEMITIFKRLNYRLLTINCLLIIYDSFKPECWEVDIWIIKYVIISVF